ncbi:MAG: hypothetical protein H0V82_06875 [Candidatus Protochlamydia sp.]|nr:hypothetical protein [Candidatus Protochlamydia sp.]
MNNYTFPELSLTEKIVRPITGLVLGAILDSVFNTKLRLAAAFTLHEIAAVVLYTLANDIAGDKGRRSAKIFAAIHLVTSTSTSVLLYQNEVIGKIGCAAGLCLAAFDLTCRFLDFSRYKASVI